MSTFDYFIKKRTKLEKAKNVLDLGKTGLKDTDKANPNQILPIPTNNLELYPKEHPKPQKTPNAFESATKYGPHPNP